MQDPKQFTQVAAKISVEHQLYSPSSLRYKYFQYSLIRHPSNFWTNINKNCDKNPYDNPKETVSSSVETNFLGILNIQQLQFWQYASVHIL